MAKGRCRGGVGAGKIDKLKTELVREITGHRCLRSWILFFPDSSERVGLGVGVGAEKRVAAAATRVDGMRSGLRGEAYF